MNAEHEPRQNFCHEDTPKDFSVIENPGLRKFLEEFSSNPPVSLDSSIKVWDAMQISFDRLKTYPEVGEKLRDIPGNQVHNAAKKLSIFIQRKHILYFDPLKEQSGVGEFKTVKGDSFLALAAVSYVFTQTNFIKESNLGQSHPELNKSELLEKIEELHKTGVFEGVLRPPDIPFSVWRDDFKKRMQDLGDEFESERFNSRKNSQRTVAPKPREFSDMNELELGADVLLDDDIVFTHQGFNEGIIIYRIDKGIREGKYKEWTTERLLNLADTDYDDPAHSVVPMTEDVYFMVKTIMVAVSKKDGDAYKYGRMQNEINYREYREILTGIGIVMDNTEQDLIFQRMMPKEDRGTLLLSDVFKHVWSQLHKSKLDFPRESS